MRELTANEARHTPRYKEAIAGPVGLRRAPRVNIPNALSLSRVALTPVFLWLFFSEVWYRQLLGVLVFVVASLTDVYDGHFARKRKDVTDLGRFLDPLADKVLVCSTLIALVAINLVSLWMAAVIIFRDLAITALRVHAVRCRRPIVTSRLAKCKTIAQLGALSVIVAVRSLMTALVSHHLAAVSSSYQWVSATANILVAAIMLITVISGIVYLLNNRHLHKRRLQAV